MADAAIATTALDGVASVGDFVIQLAATAGLAADQVVAIGTGATLDYRQVVRNVVSALSITTTTTERSVHAAAPL